MVCYIIIRAPLNINPFYVKVIAGNMSVSRVQGELKMANGAVPPPPFNLAIARMAMLAEMLMA